MAFSFASATHSILFDRFNVYDRWAIRSRFSNHNPWRLLRKSLPAPLGEIPINRVSANRSDNQINPAQPDGTEHKLPNTKHREIHHQRSQDPIQEIIPTVMGGDNVRAFGGDAFPTGRARPCAAIKVHQGFFRNRARKIGGCEPDDSRHSYRDQDGFSKPMGSRVAKMEAEVKHHG